MCCVFIAVSKVLILIVIKDGSGCSFFFFFDLALEETARYVTKYQVSNDPMHVSPTINAPPTLHSRRGIYAAYYNFLLKAAGFMLIWVFQHMQEIVMLSFDLLLAVIYMLETSELVVFGVVHCGPCMLLAWSCVSSQDMACSVCQVALQLTINRKKAKKRYPIYVIATN